VRFRRTLSDPKLASRAAVGEGRAGVALDALPIEQTLHVCAAFSYFSQLLTSAETRTRTEGAARHAIAAGAAQARELRLALERAATGRSASEILDFFGRAG